VCLDGAQPPSVDGQLPFLNAATPEFLKILGIEIVEGRGFTDADDRGAPVVIVNETMARGVWPGEQAVGKCIRIGFDPNFDPSIGTGPPMPSTAVACREVVGVARDVRQRSLLPTDHEAALMQYFVPFSQIPVPPFAPKNEPMVSGLLLRTRASAESLSAPIRRLVLGTHTDLPFVRVQPYVNLLDGQMRPWRLGTTLLAWFSALALGVAAIGLYAAFTHAVEERRREMAIRIAIGAQPASVMRLVLREALTLAGAGAILGAIAAVFAGRVVQSLLFGTTPSDPIVLASAGAAMLVIAALATILPARAAAASNPNELLRSS
jgi:hypothetical protein